VGLEKNTMLNHLINYDSPACINKFLDEQGLGIQKQFGQNFLIHRESRNRLVNALSAPVNSGVWEVGPGLGAMTEILLDTGVELTAFEIDKGFSRILRTLYGSCPNFYLVEGDVLKTWQKYVHSRDAMFFLGNLPYNIAATLLANLIEKGKIFERMVVTVQKEVAQRILAQPGTEAYSSFSVLCASVYTIRSLMTLKGVLFYPSPRVESQAIILEARKDVVFQDYPANYWQLIRYLFAARRKTLKNNLARYIEVVFKGTITLDDSREIAQQVLTTTGISVNERAETLSLESFRSLALAVEQFVFR
jgi:16S rRNA (adenine1518-N6/adenine1519-N6)-dimethyltransferase